MNTFCANCKHSLDEKGRLFDNASSRAFCSLKLDPETNQPVAAESQRFPASDPAGVCGQSAIFWEAR